MKIREYFTVNGCLLDSDFKYAYGHNDPIPFQCVIVDMDHTDDVSIWLRLDMGAPNEDRTRAP